jgi:hypothetical protein
MAYPTTAALVAASSVTELTDLTGPQQDGLRSAAITAVENYTGQVFEPVTGTKVIDGSGSRELYLPARLESFTAVGIKGVGIPITEFAISDQKHRLYFSGAVGNYYEQALLDGSEPKDFTYEPGAIAITGIWGWTTCPPAIVIALRYDMEDQALADANAISPTIGAWRKLGLSSISQGNLSATFAKHAPTLTSRVLRLVEPYAWAGEIGRVA